MTAATRLILVLMLAIATAATAPAQETKTTTAAADETAAVTDTAAEATTTAEAATSTAVDAGTEQRAQPIDNSSYAIRNRFSALLRRHPTEVGMVLALDPTLLTNESYLAGYPQIAQFVADNPEVQRNPRFYLAEFRPERDDGGILEDIMEGLLIFGIFVFIAFVLAWVIRTIIEQKRWNRLSRTQAEVHNKILDRFGTSEELMAYVKSPAGTKFLESAPIPVRAEKPVQTAPHARIMWSIQLGIVLALGALGMLLVSLRFEAATARELFAMGMIVFCVGAGFIASAFVSIAMSRRLGAWVQGNDEAARNAFDESGLMR